MINKIYNHFILIDKCAEETRIVEILEKKIVKFISWYDGNPPIIGDIYEAFIIKKLNGRVARARLKDNSIITVRGVYQSFKEGSLIKVIIMSDKFDDKPVQAKLLNETIDLQKTIETMNTVDKIIHFYFTKDLPRINDSHAIYWDILDLDRCYYNALNPNIKVNGGGMIWIEKTKAATLIDIDTEKLILNTPKQLYDFCMLAFKQCLAEIKLRNIGGMILIDFPRMSLPKRKVFHEEIISAGKATFNDGDFLGFSRLLLYEIYIPRHIGLLEDFYKDNNDFIFQNHLRSLWRKSKEIKSKNNIQFICGKNLFKKIKKKKTPEFISILERNDLPSNYGELIDLG
jgi:hypothetical protein